MNRASCALSHGVVRRATGGKGDACNGCGGAQCSRSIYMDPTNNPAAAPVRRRAAFLVIRNEYSYEIYTINSIRYYSVYFMGYHSGRKYKDLLYIKHGDQAVLIFKLKSGITYEKQHIPSGRVSKPFFSTTAGRESKTSRDVSMEFDLDDKIFGTRS